MTYLLLDFLGTLYFCLIVLALSVTSSSGGSGSFSVILALSVTSSSGGSGSFSVILALSVTSSSGGSGSFSVILALSVTSSSGGSGSFSVILALSVTSSSGGSGSFSVILALSVTSSSGGSGSFSVILALSVTTSSGGSGCSPLYWHCLLQVQLEVVVHHPLLVLMKYAQFSTLPLIDLTIFFTTLDPNVSSLDPAIVPCIPGYCMLIYFLQHKHHTL